MPTILVKNITDDLLKELKKCLTELSRREKEKKKINYVIRYVWA